MADVLLALALVFVGIFVILSIMIVHEVNKRGVKINFFLLRISIINYVHQYKQFNKQETGKVGPLYYPTIISVNLALILGIAGAILK